MPAEISELDRMQNAYKAAVEEWITAIRQEEALASVTHSVAEIDKWEQAHLKEDEIRSKVKKMPRNSTKTHCAKSSLGFDKGASGIGASLPIPDV